MTRNIFNRNGKQSALLFIILSLFAFAPLHHGWSSYDQTKPTNVTGKILEMTYENPHGDDQASGEKKEMDYRTCSTFPDGKPWANQRYAQGRFNGHGSSVSSS